MKLSNALIVYANPTTKEHQSTLDNVKHILKEHRISYNLANRDRLGKSQFKNKGFIIAVGGDGTFLRAAHFVKDQVIFGVNADSKNKEGFFMQSHKRNFEAKLTKLIMGEIMIKKMPRLEAYINNNKIDNLALNEFFIGAKKAYQSAKYKIGINGKKEAQKSSGILVTTPAGSYSWAKSCYGKTLDLDSKKFQLVVREPYEGKIFRNYKLSYCVLNRNQKVTIISEMLDGIIIADSVGKEYRFKNGSKATIKLSNSSLNVVWQE